jgi:hypothetical protein
MADSQLFIKAPDSNNGGAPVPGMSAVSIMDAEEPSEYGYGRSQGPVIGTLLPRARKHGGVQGSSNPYGSIVTGEKITQQGREPFQPRWLEQDGVPTNDEVVMPEITSEGIELESVDEPSPAEEADQKVAEEQEEREGEFQQQIARAKDAEARLASIMERSTEVSTGVPLASPPPMDVAALCNLLQDRLTGSGVLSPPPPTTALPPEASTLSASQVRVTMQGSFGTYKGQYLVCYDFPGLIVLVHDLDSPVFSPPPSADLFNISCQDSTYDVYFAGIEFELPFAKCGIQVMIRGE